MGAAYRGSCTIIIDNNNNNNKSLFFSAGYRDRTRTAGVLTTTPRTPRKLLVLRFASCVRCHCSTCSLRYACKPFEQPAQVPRKFGLASTQPHRKCYKSAMSSNNRPLVSAKSKISQKRQKHNYDKRVRGAVVEPGDLVLVKVVAFDGKHKIADRWENDTYAVLSQPNPGIPVYVVQREDKGGPKRTLHRNLLLPIPLDSGTTNDRNTVMDQNDDSPADTHSVDDVRDNDSDSISSGDTQDTQDYHDVIQIDEDLDSDDPDPAEHAAMPPIVPRHIEPTPVVHQPVITEPAAAEPVPVEPIQHPQPAPRRSLRQRKPPEWIQSGDFSMSHVASSDHDWIAKVDQLKTLASVGKYAGMQNMLCQAMIDVMVK